MNRFRNMAVRRCMRVAVSVIVVGGSCVLGWLAGVWQSRQWTRMSVNNKALIGRYMNELNRDRANAWRARLDEVLEAESGKSDRNDLNRGAELLAMVGMPALELTDTDHDGMLEIGDGEGTPLVVLADWIEADRIADKHGVVHDICKPSYVGQGVYISVLTCHMCYADK